MKVRGHIFTARKRSLRRLCFYRCLSVHTGGHAWLLRGGACVVAPRGVHGCSGGLVHGCSWGGMCGCSWGDVWFFLGGGIHGFSQRGMHGFSGGACVVFPGGVRGFFWGGACVGYDEIRSMSGRYASYWNAFLSFIVRLLHHHKLSNFSPTIHKCQLNHHKIHSSKM